MFTTIILISLKIDLEKIEFKNITYPVEAVAGEIGTEASTPEATCISGAERSG